MNRFFRTHLLHWIEFPACVGSSKIPKDSCSVASPGPTASDLLVFAPRTEFGNRYSSLTSAAKALEVSPSTVRRRAAGRKSADEAATSRLTLDIEDKVNLLLFLCKLVGSPGGGSLGLFFTNTNGTRDRGWDVLSSYRQR